MPLPNLIHPVDVVLRKLNRADTIVDDDYREPVQSVAYTDYTVKGQVNWGSSDKAVATELGSKTEASGYVLFRRIDLRKKGVSSVAQGDRIVSSGSGANAVSMNLFIVDVKYEGHYPDQGGPTLIKAYFRDRSPTEARTA